MKRLVKRLLQLALIGLALTAAFLTARPPANAVSQTRPRFVGVQACAECHRDIAVKQQQTTMARAMVSAADCQVLRSHPSLKFQQGKFAYRITRDGDRSVYEITNGLQTVTAPLLYAFGQGFSGQTYVYEYSGVLYESRVSFYNDTNALDITLGHAPDPPESLIEAGGRAMSLDETRNCFGCHTTNAKIEAGAAPNKPPVIQLNHKLGVSCESCHGAGEQHVAAAKSGQPASGLLKRLQTLDGDDLSQTVCGACHRSVDDVIEMPNHAGKNNVRFQPYRIFNSRCYSADKRIGCTACHDPHGNLNPEPAFYDAKCTACHQVSKAEPAARVCKTGKRDCVSCHMPKIELTGAHFKFTDHRIRIARAGEPYPK